MSSVRNGEEQSTEIRSKLPYNYLRNILESEHVIGLNDHKYSLPLSNICRTCLTADKSLSSISELAFEEEDLIELMMKYASIIIRTDDHLPQKICENCIREVARTHNFIKKCQASESQLINLLSINDQSDDNEIAHRNESAQDNKVTSEDDDTEDDEAIEKEERKSEYEFIQEQSAEEEFKAKEKGPPYACHKCKESFDVLQELRYHMKRTGHYKGGQFECPTCLKLFKRNHLLHHMRTHNEEKPFVCSVCAVVFSFRSNLLRHMKIHSGERPHTCKFCGKGFIRSTSLTEHERVHTGETPYECDRCPKKYAQSSQYLQHKRFHEAMDSKLLADYQCKLCKKIFSSKSVLLNHTLNHTEKTYLCPECGKKFNHVGGLSSHMNTHKGARPYTCSKCGRSFTQPGSLNVHMRIHEGRKPFECKDCKKKFTQKSHLVYHERIHSGEKPYSCSLCGKSFTTKSTLVVHVRTHTGETPYSCDVCAKKFNNSSAMKKHRRVHKAKAENTNYL